MSSTKLKFYLVKCKPAVKLLHPIAFTGSAPKLIYYVKLPVFFIYLNVPFTQTHTKKKKKSRSGENLNSMKSTDRNPGKKFENEKDNNNMKTEMIQIINNIKGKKTLTLRTKITKSGNLQNEIEKLIY